MVEEGKAQINQGTVPSVAEVLQSIINIVNHPEFIALPSDEQISILLTIYNFLGTFYKTTSIEEKDVSKFNDVF